MLHDATHCTWCHEPISDDLPAGHPNKATADHFDTVHAGGGDEVGNLLPSCWTCNSKRGKMTAEQWLRHLSHDVEGAEDW